MTTPLQKAIKIQKHAARQGFEWEHTDHAVAKIHEEISELEQAYKNQNPNEILDELGDALYALISFARVMNINVESALEHSNNKFENRFNAMKDLSKKEKKDLNTLSPAEWRALWQRAKAHLAK